MRDTAWMHDRPCIVSKNKRHPQKKPPLKVESMSGYDRNDCAGCKRKFGLYLQALEWYFMKCQKADKSIIDTSYYLPWDMPTERTAPCNLCNVYHGNQRSVYDINIRELFGDDERYELRTNVELVT